MGNNQAALSFGLKKKEYSGDLYVSLLDGVSSTVSVLGGNTRFLKSTLCMDDSNRRIVVKVFLKRGAVTDLSDYMAELTEVARKLSSSKHANIVAYTRIVESEQAGFLVRPYLYMDLYERMSTRPFLSHDEKVWLSFLLLCSVHQAHSSGVVHGDIKTENILVTSWNWLYLTDFATGIKPTFVVDNDPADFSFYFDVSGRRACCLAPERFLDPTQLPCEEPATPAMDIFSVGCVIAELFLEGQPLFDLSRLLAYRSGTYDPRPALARLPPTVQELVCHMIQLDPELRLGARAYIEHWKNRLFPHSLHTLHGYMASLAPMSPDQRIMSVNANLVGLLEALGCPVGAAYDGRRAGTVSVSAHGGMQLRPDILGHERRNSLANLNAASAVPTGRTDVDPTSLLHDSQDFIRKLEDRPGASGSSDSGAAGGRSPSMSRLRERKKRGSVRLQNVAASPPSISVDAAEDRDRGSGSGSDDGGSGSGDGSDADDDDATSVEPNGPGGGNSQTWPGLMPLVSVVCSSLRNGRTPWTAQVGLDVIEECARWVDDGVKLSVLLPYAATLFDHTSAAVRAHALRIVTWLLDTTAVVPASETNVFPDFVLPALEPLTHDAEVCVRVAHAECIATLADTALRFLEMAQLYRGDQGSGATGEWAGSSGGFDAELHSLHESFQSILVVVLSDSETVVKRTILADITRLALFFSGQKTTDLLLSHLVTYLNDHDSLLRADFFQHVIGLSTVVGTSSLEQFILPLILQGLRDEDECVIERAISALSSLCEIGLFRSPLLTEVASVVVPYLCHPCPWLRYAAVGFMSAASEKLSRAAVACNLVPLIEPYLTGPSRLLSLGELTDVALLEALRPAPTRVVYNRVMTGLCQQYRSSRSDSSAYGTPGGRGAAESGSREGGNGVRGNGDDGTAVDGNAPNAAGDTVTLNNSVPSQPTSAGPTSDLSVGASLDGAVNGATGTAEGRTSESAVAGATGGGDSGGDGGGNDGATESTAATPDAKFERLLLEAGAMTSPELADCMRVLRPFMEVTAARLASGKATTAADETAAAANLRGPNNSPAPFTPPRRPSPYAGGSVGASGGGGSAGGRSGRAHSSTPTHTRPDSAQFDETTSLPARAPVESLLPTVPVHIMTVSASGELLAVNTRTSHRADLYGSSTPSQPALPAGQSPPHLQSPNQAHWHQMYGSIETRLTGESLRTWRPQGILVASLHEHGGPVRHVTVCEDNSFFATGGDDGCVRVWDSDSVANSVVNSSSTTWTHETGSPVTALTFCELSQSLATATADGRISVLRIEATYQGTEKVYRQPPLCLREIDPGQGTVVALKQFHTPNFTQALLVYATQRGGIVGHDLRVGQPVFSLVNESRFGLISAFAVDDSRSWVMAGTTRGVLSAYDLRFLLPVRSWMDPSQAAIDSLACYPTTWKKSCVFAGVGPCIKVWDIGTHKVEHVFRVATAGEDETFTPGQALPPPLHLDYGAAELQAVAVAEKKGITHRALYCVRDSNYLVSAGSDRCVRYWDLSAETSRSNVVCGLGVGTAQPQYLYNAIDNVPMCTEFKPLPSAVQSAQKDPASAVAGAQAVGVNGVGRRGPQPLYNGHIDAVCGIQLLERPFRMMVTCGRDGAVKVWK